MVKEDNDQDARTLFCANLSENVTEALLFELFLQGGPVERISIPKKEGRQCSFGFVTYTHSCSIPYALELFSGTRLFDRDLRIKSREGPQNRAQPAMSQQPFHNQQNEPTLRPSRIAQHHSEPGSLHSNPFNHESSLRTGFHGNQHQQNDMRPSRGHRNTDIVDNQLLDINKLLQMGSQLMGGNNNSSGSGGREERGGNGSNNYNSGRHSGSGHQQQYDNTARPYRRNHSPRNNHQPYDNHRSHNDRGHQNRHQSGGRQRR